jgi:branched-chain amino acid transport system permease protein
MARPSSLQAVLGVLVAALALAALPYAVSTGALFVIGLALIEALFALSWNLLFTYSGIASFGHAAFFAIGAYLVGCAQRYGWPLAFPVQLLAAFALAGAAAAGLGAAALRRVSGIHFAILTLAVAEVVRTIISYTSALGRDEGLAGIPRPILRLGFTDLALRSPAAYYWFLVAVTGLVALGLWAFILGERGRALRSLAQDPERAAFVGIDIYRYRVIAFALSGGVAGLCGGLTAPWVQIVTPDMSHWSHSAQPMLNTLLGGAGSYWGPVLGAFAYAGLNYATRTLAGVSELVIGVILLVIILVAPTGISGALGSLRRMLGRGRGGTGADGRAAEQPR